MRKLDAHEGLIGIRRRVKETIKQSENDNDDFPDESHPKR